jgi:hypothetical protein
MLGLCEVHSTSFVDVFSVHFQSFPFVNEVGTAACEGRRPPCLHAITEGGGGEPRSVHLS